MSEAKHTPGPWGFGEKPGPRAVTLKRTHWVIGVNGGKGVAIAFGDTDANAEFIVRACNSHDDLLNALRHLRNEIAGHLGIAREEIRAAVSTTNLHCLERRIEQAEAAIAKAEGRAK